jgi:hypothetical protein
MIRHVRVAWILQSNPAWILAQYYSTVQDGQNYLRQSSYFCPGCRLQRGFEIPGLYVQGMNVAIAGVTLTRFLMDKKCLPFLTMDSQFLQKCIIYMQTRTKSKILLVIGQSLIKGHLNLFISNQIVPMGSRVIQFITYEKKNRLLYQCRIEQLVLHTSFHIQ